MNKKIAIPIENGKLSGHFGHAPQFALIELNDNKLVNTKYITPPPHEPGVLPKWLANIGATDVLAGGMGQKAIDLLLDHHINVFVGVAQKSIDQLIQDLINNQLESGGNYCDH
jgi:predicted Fe-Mo cluster-binding NifX family protein